MSVSSRSPTTRACEAPRCCAATWNRAGSGLPTTTSGRRPPRAVVSAATMLPLPGTGPRVDGIVASVLVAIHREPARSATHASARSAQPTVGPYPCTTTTGPSAAPATGVRPTARISSRSDGEPTTSTGAPGGNSPASISAAAAAEVSTSSSRAGTPNERSRVRDLPGPARRVVRHVRDRDTIVHCGLNRLGSGWYRLRTEIDHPIEVEHDQVVRLGQAIGHDASDRLLARLFRDPPGFASPSTSAPSVSAAPVPTSPR